MTSIGLSQTVWFLTASTRKLSASLQDSEARVRRDFFVAGGDVAELERRLPAIQAQLLGLSVLSVSLQREHSPVLPTIAAATDRAIRTLNLPLEPVLDAYISAPILVEPFLRPCALSARSLNDKI